MKNGYVMIDVDTFNALVSLLDGITVKKNEMKGSVGGNVVGHLTFEKPAERYINSNGEVVAQIGEDVEFEPIPYIRINNVNTASLPELMDLYKFYGGK